MRKKKTKTKKAQICISPKCDKTRTGRRTEKDESAGKGMEVGRISRTTLKRGGGRKKPGKGRRDKEGKHRQGPEGRKPKTRKEGEEELQRQRKRSRPERAEGRVS